MKIEGDKVIFSSGRSHYANNGIIGLSPSLTVSEGYDGGFYQPPYDEWDEPAKYGHPTKEDMIELADYMINQWYKFKELHSSNNTLKEGE